jgi:hypothetical protein
MFLRTGRRAFNTLLQTPLISTLDRSLISPRYRDLSENIFSLHQGFPNMGETRNLPKSFRIVQNHSLLQ